MQFSRATVHIIKPYEVQEVKYLEVLLKATYFNFPCQAHPTGIGISSIFNLIRIRLYVTFKRDWV